MDTPPATSSPGSNLQWYRFTLLLTGNATEAARILQEVMTTGSEQAAFFRNESGWRRWLVRRIRNQCQAEAHTPAPGEGRLTAIAGLPEPARSAYALFQTLPYDSDELAELIELRPGALAHALARARETLAPGSGFPGDARVPLHRPWREDNPAVARAVEKTRQNPREAALLKAQVEFDRSLHEEVGQTKPVGELYFPEFKRPAPPALGSLLRQPAVLALAIAFAVVLGVVVLFALRKMDEFPGREWVHQLIETSIGEAGAEFEPITPQPVGRLADWFMLKGFDHFSVPPEIGNAIAVGCRLIDFQEVPVAQVALQEGDSVLFVFPETPPRRTEASPEWNVYQHDGLAVAVHGTERNGYIIAFPGRMEEMDGFLRQLRHSSPPGQEPEEEPLVEEVPAPAPEPETQAVE